MSRSFNDVIAEYSSSFFSDETCNCLEYLAYYYAVDRTEYYRYRNIAISNFYGWFYPNSSIEDKDFLLNYKIEYEKDLKPFLDEVEWLFNDSDEFRERCVSELQCLLEDVYEHDMIEFKKFLNEKKEKIITYDGEL